MGCFVGSSKISVPNGKTPIQDVRLGDLVLRPLRPLGKEFVEATVKEVFESEEELISLVTTHGALLTTVDQLFPCLDRKERKTQDLMGHFIGYLLDDKELVYVKVVAVIPKGIKAKVFHLHVEEPNLYFCDGFLVHNKGGGSSSSESTASIAPELQPLFKQTGDLMMQAQMFNPSQYIAQGGQYPAPVPPIIPAYGQPYYNPFVQPQPWQPTQPGMEQLSFNPPPIQDPGMVYAVGAPATQPVSTTSSPSFGRLQEIERLQTRPSGQMGFDTQDPKEIGLYYEYNQLRQEMGLAPISPVESYTDPSSGGTLENRWAPFTPTTSIPGGEGPMTPPITAYPVPGQPSPTLGQPPVAGEPYAPVNTSQLPGSILDEFLFANPQFIPQATGGQRAILGRQRERAFSPPTTPQELIAQFMWGGLGQMRPGEQFATNVTGALPFQRPEEQAAIGIGGRFGQLYGPEQGGLNAASRLGQRYGVEQSGLDLASLFGQLRGPEQTSLGYANQFGQLRNPEMSALGRAGQMPQLSPQEMQALGISQGFGQLYGPEQAGLGIGTTLGQLRGPEAPALGSAARAGELSQQELIALGMSGGFGQLQGPEQAALTRAGGLGQLYGPEQFAAGLAPGFGQLRTPEEYALLQANELTGGPLGSSPATQAAMQAATDPILNRLAEAGLGRSGAIQNELGAAYAPILAQEMALRAQVIPQLAGIGSAQRQGDIAAGQLTQRLGEAQRSGDTTAVQAYQRAGEAMRQGDIAGAQNYMRVADAQRQGLLSGAQIQSKIADAMRAGDTTSAQMYQRAGEAMRQGSIAEAQNFLRTGDAQRQGLVSAAGIEQRAGEAQRAGDQAAAQMYQRAGEAQRQGDIAGAQVYMQAGEAQRRGDQAGAQIYMGAGDAQRRGDIAQATQLTSIAQAARAGSVQAAQIQSAIANAQRTGDTEGARRLAEIGDTLVKRESTLLGEAGTSEETVRQLQAQQAESITNDLLRRQAIASNLTTGMMGGFPAIGGTTTVSKQSAPSSGMTVICTELYRQRMLDEETYRADAEFGRSLPQEILDGYQLWAVPLARGMARSRLLTAFVALFALPWAKEMRKRVNGNGGGSWLGRAMLFVGIPACRWIGSQLNRKTILGKCWG